MYVINEAERPSLETNAANVTSNSFHQARKRFIEETNQSVTQGLRKDPLSTFISNLHSGNEDTALINESGKDNTTK
jgi:hypothetical protein